MRGRDWPVKELETLVQPGLTDSGKGSTAQDGGEERLFRKSEGGGYGDHFSLWKISLMMAEQNISF